LVVTKSSIDTSYCLDLELQLSIDCALPQTFV